jgi:peptidoglycan hydrolase CwlO-like protein
MEQYNESPYINVGTAKPVTKTAEQKTIESLEQAIKELNSRIDTQYKVVDKLVKDVRKIKDHISELAGRISRG